MKGSPLRDAAGLLRSFDYAVAAAATGTDRDFGPVGERRAALLEKFRDEASVTFLKAYRSVLHSAERPWVPPAAEEPHLDLFLMEKAAYEIRYETANRPAWLRIPLQGLHRIAERVLRPRRGTGRMNEIATEYCRSRDDRSDRPWSARRSVRDPRPAPGSGGLVIRTFQPDAVSVAVVERATDDVVGMLRRVHPGGLFSGSSTRAPTYRLRIDTGDALRETEDPYSFAPLLGALDVHLLAEGRHFESRPLPRRASDACRGRARRALRRLGAQRAARFGRWRFQRLGRAAPSDAAPLRRGRVGDFHPTARPR